MARLISFASTFAILCAGLILAGSTAQLMARRAE
jgi:hypothetical protein